jgi:hypothetical protein
MWAMCMGLARNKRLNRALGQQMAEARAEHELTGKSARRFRDFRYRTRKSWSCERRVVGKAEVLPGKENPRFVVTNLPASRADAKYLYEQTYCGRGEMENRIKEQQLCLFADRTSTRNDARPTRFVCGLSSLAYVLVSVASPAGPVGHSARTQPSCDDDPAEAAEDRCESASRCARSGSRSLSLIPMRTTSPRSWRMFAVIRRGHRHADTSAPTIP